MCVTRLRSWLIMVALCNRAGHYIFALWFLFIFSISAAADWISTILLHMLSSNISSRCLHNMVNFGPLADEIVSLVWGTPGNFNGFRVLAALLHGTLVVGVRQTLRRWTEGATYVRQGGHHVGHCSTFLVYYRLPDSDWLTMTSCY